MTTVRITMTPKMVIIMAKIMAMTVTTTTNVNSNGGEIMTILTAKTVMRMMKKIAMTAKERLLIWKKHLLYKSHVTKKGCKKWWRKGHWTPFRHINIFWHVSARHLSFRCSATRKLLMTVNHYTTYTRFKSIHWLRKQIFRFPLLAMLLFIDAVHMHLLP